MNKTLTMILHAQVAADVSRRYLRRRKHAPTDVGGYALRAKRASLMVAALLVGFVVNVASASAQLQRMDIFVAGEGGYHTYRIPALIVTSNQTLLGFCEGRKNSASDTGNIDLLLKRSTDCGKTWGEPQVVWDDGPNTCGNPCPVVDETTGTIWLLLTHNPGDTGEARIMEGKAGGTRTVWLCRSVDDGKTWTPPVDITASAKDPSWGWYATGPGVGIQIQHGPRRGRLVIPCDHSSKGTDRAQGGSAAETGSHIIYSDDHGQTWKLGGWVRPQMDESQVIELSDGAGGLLLNMRNTAKANRRAQSLSRDGGQTWTTPEFPPELVEPRCQASLLRYNWPDGKEPGRLLFSNPASPRRRDLTVRVSRDDGKTWPVSRPLHEGPAAYSCLTVLPDKSIGCLYECGRTNPYEKISFACFPLEWLERGN
jgi:sialidase-1